MRRLQALCMATIVLLLPCWSMPTGVFAASSSTAVDMPLLPINTTDSIILVAYILHAELRCDDTGCRVDVEQIYQLRNQGQETVLKLGLAAVDGLPAYALRIEGGPALGPGAPSADYVATWDISLGRNEQKRLVLSSSHPPQQGKIVSWRCEMPYLAPWGAIQGARMEFVFPQPITDDALLVVQPGNQGVGEGGLLYWDYETLQDPQTMQVVALSPAAWQQFQELRREQKHGDLARLYEALYREAQEKGLPMADPYARELAEWMAALESGGDDQEARENLARLYRARADAVPALRLNYLLLLAEQLEVLRERTGEAEIANELVRIYEEASKIASQNNDSAGALKYLRQASAVPGAAPSGNQEMLALHLALSLAQEGQVAEALQQVQDILAPDLRQVLDRYMPPFSSARAEVMTGSQERVVRYQLFLYPPAAQKANARLEEIAAILRPIEGCQISWQSPGALLGKATAAAPVTATLTMTMAYPSLATLEERCGAVVESLASDPDLVSAFVAIPWQSAPTVYDVERGLWRDRLLYESEEELASLKPLWEEGSEYVRWQLVEFRNAVPEGERAQIEQQLALLMLEQQSQTWELIPSGTYIVHQVVYPGFPTYQPTWLLSWGQQRVLRAEQTFYRWDRVLATMAAATVLLVLILARLLQRI